jgi:hypothetical protein
MRATDYALVADARHGRLLPDLLEAGVSSRTRKLNGHLFYVQTTQADGKVSSYLIDTKRSQVTTVTR